MITLLIALGMKSLITASYAGENGIAENGDDINKSLLRYIQNGVAMPPKLSASDFMGYLKGKSTLMLYGRHPELQSKWDKVFGVRGYYVETIGNVTDEAG